MQRFILRRNLLSYTSSSKTLVGSLMRGDRRSFSSSEGSSEDDEGVVDTEIPTIRAASRIVVPWEEDAILSGFPAHTHPIWTSVGQAVLKVAASQDLGGSALEECGEARSQIEVMLQNSGYRNFEVFTFGALATLDMMEVGGDADFCAVGDVEPSIEEASEIVSRLGRELRRLGLRCFPSPKARLPVIKGERTSFVLPGTPLSKTATTGVFQAVQEFTPSQQRSFMLKVLSNEWEGLEVHWIGAQSAHVTFSSTSALCRAVSSISEHAGIPIPLRTPVNPQDGPELYRYPFDLTFSSTGLRNAAILNQGLQHYEFARHLAIVTKRWGKAAGIISTGGGLLSSYGQLIMLTHFLVAAGALPKLDLRSVPLEPQALPKYPQYRPLLVDSSTNTTHAAGDPQEMQTLGYLFGHYFRYFSQMRKPGGGSSLNMKTGEEAETLEGGKFNYDVAVACTTILNLKKGAIPTWRRETVAHGDTSNVSRPPFYNLCIKDPYCTHNIGQNLDSHSTNFVAASHARAQDKFVDAVSEGRSPSAQDLQKLVHDIINSPGVPSETINTWDARAQALDMRRRGSHRGVRSTGINPNPRGISRSRGSMDPRDFINHATGGKSSVTAETRVKAPPSSVEEQDLQMKIGSIFQKEKNKRRGEFGKAIQNQESNTKSAQELTTKVLKWIRPDID